MPNKRFTIYDMMEAKGLFELNPANAQSRDPVTGEGLYKGPVEYPKMMYHPKGEEKITVQAEMVATPFGPKMVGEQREIIHCTVNNAEEEEEKRAAGWWDHPAKAMTAAGKVAPAISSDSRIKDLEAQLARVTKELNAAHGVQADDQVLKSVAPKGKPGLGQVTTVKVPPEAAA